jgi:hypothetical protein
MTLIINEKTLQHCYHAQYCILFIVTVNVVMRDVMLSVIMLSVTMLNVIKLSVAMLNVIMLNAEACHKILEYFKALQYPVI